MVVATVKPRPVFKRALKGLLNEGCTKWKRSWGHDEKVMFLSHDSKTCFFIMTPGPLPLCTPLILKSF